MNNVFILTDKTENEIKNIFNKYSKNLIIKFSKINLFNKSFKIYDENKKDITKEVILKEHNTAWFLNFPHQNIKNSNMFIKNNLDQYDFLVVVDNLHKNLMEMK